ncbi:MAG: hypothetical protein RLP15_12370 [Cryomorphaceae bacterium]
MTRILVLGMVLIGLSTSAFAQKTVDCKKVFDFSYDQWEKTSIVQYSSAKVERHLNKTQTASFDFTIQREPFKVAGRMRDKGHFILYDTEASTTQAWYISNGFPFTNLSLDINGKMFRGLNHYTISDAGCNFIFSIIREQYMMLEDKFQCSHVMRKGKEEILIEASADDWAFRTYVAQKGETVLDIAKKFSISAYLIIERNEGVDQYQDDCSGKKLLLPNYYGKKIRLYVSAEHGLPMLIEVYDDRGLLEQVEYSNYKFDTTLPADYFTVDYLDKLD